MRPIRSRIARALCVVCAAAVALPASAGTLGDFEGAATTPKPGPAPAPRSGSVGSNAGHAGGGVRIDNSLTGLQSGDLVVLVAIGLVAGAQLSLGRMQGAPSVAGIRTTPRERGDPDLPMLRLDANHQNVQGDVRAGDFRLETGYGPLAVQARYTRFREDIPRDTLDLTYVHGLVRISATSTFGLDFGVGSAWLAGNERHNGFSGTVAMAWRPHERVELRFAPAWSSIQDRWIRDHDVSAALVMPYASLRVGYRWVAVNGATLKGPYAGISLHF